MFRALPTLTAPAPTPPTPTAAPVARNKDRDVLRTRLTTSVLVVGHSLRLASAAIAAHLLKGAAMEHDFVDLRRLRGVTQTYGLSKPLMVFVNPKHRGITSGVKNLPANESLDAVPMAPDDDRSQQALSAMDDTLDTEPKLVADWIRTGGDAVDTTLSAASDQMKMLGQAVSHYLLELEHTELSDEQLTGCQVSAMPMAQALSCIEALLDVLPDLDADVSDPTDRDAMDAHKQKLAAIVDSLGERTGLCLDPDCAHQAQLGDTPEAVHAQSASAAELGYTVGALIELLKKADSLIDEVEGLIERKDAVVGKFEAAATMTEGMDNDVPPAVDGAISDDDTDGGTLTQAGVMHAQASSHVCCIAAVIDASSRVVQHVLCVAQCLDQIDPNDVIDLGALGEAEETEDDAPAPSEGDPTPADPDVV